MIKDLTVDKSINIKANKASVWDVLTNPEKISEYLFGTETITDWKEGSNIVFQGNYEGHEYKDKGVVVTNKMFEVLQYKYWAQFSGLEDKLENYSTVTYSIEEVDEKEVNFTWKQEGFASEKGHEHTENSLMDMLQKIKEIAER